MIRSVSTLIALGLLAACGGEAEPVVENADAGGDVLEGSISDAMLPLDTLTSQSPPLEDQGDEDGGSGETGASASDNEDGE